jgi:hypothetical protein
MAQAEKDMWDNLDWDKVEGWCVNFAVKPGVKVITITLKGGITQTHEINLQPKK